MRRIECLRTLSALLRDDALVVCNLQDTTYEWNAVRPSDGNLLRMGMALVTPVALGIAISLPHRRVVALDGDGSMVLGLGSLTTLGRYAPPNLTVIVFDNECFNSGGTLPTPTAFGTDLAAVATASGVRNSVTVADLGAFGDAARTALEARETWLVVAKVDRAPEVVPRPRIDGTETKYRFVRHVEALEQSTILPADEQKSFQ